MPPRPVPAPRALAEPLAALFARERPPGVASAYLFGAHAEGRAHRDSDVDVGVVLDRAHFSTAAARFEARLALGAWLVAELHAPIVDLIVLDDATPGLAAHVATRGVRLYCADPEIDHALRRDAQLRAADLAPFLARARRLKLAALAR